jgi:hypothetical protein
MTWLTDNRYRVGIVVVGLLLVGSAYCFRDRGGLPDLSGDGICRVREPMPQEGMQHIRVFRGAGGMANLDAVNLDSADMTDYLGDVIGDRGSRANANIPSGVPSAAIVVPRVPDSNSDAEGAGLFDSLFDEASSGDASGAGGVNWGWLANDVRTAESRENSFSLSEQPQERRLFDNRTGSDDYFQSTRERDQGHFWRDTGRFEP